MAHLTEDDVLLEHNAAIASLTPKQRAAIERCARVSRFSRGGRFPGRPVDERLREVCRQEALMRRFGGAIPCSTH